MMPKRRRNVKATDPAERVQAAAPAAPGTNGHSASREPLAGYEEETRRLDREDEERRRREEQELQARLDAQIAREVEEAAAGRIPDFVAPEPVPAGQIQGRLYADWIGRQPVTVAGRADRAELPYRIYDALLNHFGLERYWAEHWYQEWIGRCKPGWSFKHLSEQRRRVHDEIEAKKKAAADDRREGDLLGAWSISEAGQLGGSVAGTDYPLLEGLLPRYQPGVIGGPVKSLKTTLAAEMAVCVASGKPFLGRFPVGADWRGRTAHPVLMLSGESGEAALSDTLSRICAAKGVDPRGLPLLVGTRLPRLDCPEDLKELKWLLWRRRIGLLIYDPLYLGVRGGTANPSDLYAMGALLATVNDACLDADCTLLLVHHSTKDLAPGRLMTLQDLAFAGLGEFVRSWLLVNRRRPYDPSQPGRHALSVCYGGSAGHAGALALDVDEGAAAADGTGRRWDVTARELADVGDERPRRRRDPADDQAERLVEAIRRLAPDGGRVEQPAAKTEAGLSGAAMAGAVRKLSQDGSVLVHQTTKRKGRRCYQVTELELPGDDH